MYTGILSLGKNPGENPISFKVYVCCIFGFQEKNGQRMSKVHLSGSQRCIFKWPQLIFSNFKHRTPDLVFSLSRSMFIERSVKLLIYHYIMIRMYSADSGAFKAQTEPAARILLPHAAFGHCPVTWLPRSMNLFRRWSRERLRQRSASKEVLFLSLLITTGWSFGVGGIAHMPFGW